LDPSRIVGSTRSTTATGFHGLAESDAEIYYIKIPSTDLNTTLHTSPLVTEVQIHGDSSFTIVATTKLNDSTMGVEFMFYYDFSKDMDVKEVRYSTVTQQVYAQMAGQGLVKGRIDPAYLANLKEGVRYWDGQNWQKEVVKVRHSGGVASK
jgi:hypothetical protein